MHFCLSYSASIRSPLGYTSLFQRIFRLMNIFNHETESAFLSKYHGPIAYMLRWIFLHFASILQTISLFMCSSVVEVSTVLFIASSWLNMSFRDLLFMVKKRKVLELWHELDAEDFKVKTSAEFQLVSIIVFKSFEI